MVDSVDVEQGSMADGLNVLNEGVWRAWLAKSASRERRAAASRVVAIKCMSIWILAATALLWRYAPEYDLWIRFGVCLGGVVVLVQALRLRRYAFAAAFVAITVIYNPVVPMFKFAGPGPFGIVLTTALAFAASLVWLREDQPSRRYTSAIEVGGI